MSTVVERCAGLAERMEQLKRRQELQGKAEQLEPRRQELEQRRQNLADTVRRGSVLTEAGCIEKSDWPRVMPIRPLIASVREKLREDPARTTSGRDYKNLLSGLDRTVESLNKVVEEAWTSVCTAADPVDEKLLLRLEQVPGQSAAVERVRSLRRHLKQLGAVPPVTKADYDAFVAYANALSEAWGDLDHGDLPEAVLKFLKAAQGTAGAATALWTTEVQAWLKQHGLLEGVRIYYRGGR